MASWSLVATVKAPEAKVLAFVAHHLSLGAEHLWLYLDNPEDPAHAALARLPRVTATLCTDDYWAANAGERPSAHQNRQVRNAKDAYRRCKSDWLVHIDVDEFIFADRPVTDVLDAAPDDEFLVRMEPFEAMHDPSLPDDIYTARVFRGAIRHAFWRLRKPTLGEFRAVIRNGMLSHSVGKVFFRTGVSRLVPRIHSVMLRGVRAPVPDYHPEMRLLHFHAQDRQAWQDAVPFRVTRGAYKFNPPLQSHLASASLDEIDAFYRGTQTMDPDVTAALVAVGRAVTAELGLAAKVQALKEGRLP
jgi:Glycosyl transferase family 2